MTNPINIHISAGQSNGWGSGDALKTPIPPVPNTCLTYWNNTYPVITPGSFQILETRTMCVNTGTGCMWTSFQIQRYAICNTPSLMIWGSVGGSYMSGLDGGHHWGRNGNLFQRAIDATEDAKFQIALRGYTPTIRTIEWCQGEAEAGLLANGSITKEFALEKLLDIAAHFREIYPAIRFNIYRTGRGIGQSDSGFAEIRWAQEEAARIDPYISIVYRGAVGFVERGLINTSDNIHWTQPGLNEAGTIGAINGFS